MCVFCCIYLFSFFFKTEEKVEQLSKALDNATISLAEAEDQREKLKVEGAQVSKLLKFGFIKGFDKLNWPP